MFGKKRRYEKSEVESIMGIALNIKERKGEKPTEDDINKIKKAGLDKDKIKKKADKFKTDKQKEKEKIEMSKKKNPIKEKKEKRNKKKIGLYITYFVVWGIIITMLIIPFIIEENTDIEIEFLWLFIMIGTSIVGIITGTFIAEIEGLIGGFFIGAVMGLGLYFLLRIETGRIISIIFLSVLAIFLFFFVFRSRFKKMIKNK